MFKYQRIIILLLIIWCFSYCKSVNIETEKETITTPKTNPFIKDDFPKSWVGDYKGDLEIYSVDSIGMKLKMQLKIAQKSDSIYNWTIIYDFKGKEDVRAYQLKVADSKKGHYIIDEKNSILIDAFYRNKIFTSFFEVNKSYIVATYTKENDNIIFEIISANGNKVTTTGNSIIKNDTIPQVKTYFVNGRQKAILKLSSNKK